VNVFPIKTQNATKFKVDDNDGALNPDWASINLCVVICKNCAGTTCSRGSTSSLIPESSFSAVSLALI
uniref:Uncharacterized protein n=1 Tax=Neolamprologus brichardi TaxID=32507 RepID=A0A3Q4MZM4_NEOBR